MRRKIGLMLLAFLAFFTIALASSQRVKAAEPLGKIVFHYQLWDGDYSSAGLWCWGTGDGGASAPVTSDVTDEFGAVYELPIGEGATDVGIIALRKDISLDSRWNYRETPDGENFTVDATPITSGAVTEMHIYYFQGGYQTYYVADTTKVNILVAYYDPTAGYEDNLGFHSWGSWTNVENPAWATPLKAFNDGFKSPGEIKGKVALLQIDEKDVASAGFLIYAGDDVTKKTPSQDTYKYITDMATLKNGDVKVLYVTGGAGYYGDTAIADFATAAFAFDFIGFNASDMTGTYAVDPSTIFAKTTLALTTKVVVGTEMVTKTKIIQVPQLAAGSTPFVQTDKTFTEFTSLPALDAGMVGRVVLHYQAWDGDYTGVGVWSWNRGTVANSGLPMIGVDSFGAVVDIQVAADMGDSIGFIPMKAGVPAATNEWGAGFVKSFDGDLTVDVTAIKAGTVDEIHIYYFEGGSKGFIIDPAQANVLLVYYDLTGTYEETLGLHGWGNWTNPEFVDLAWGSPAQVFENGLTSPKSLTGKVALLKGTDLGNSGFLIYAGGDDSKKTVDNASNSITDLGTLAAGDVRVLYVALGETYYGVAKKAEFAEAAFSGEIEYVDKEVEYQEEVDVMEYVDFTEYFKLYKGTTEVALKQIDFNKTADSTNEFVIQLADGVTLDNTATYTLKFNDGAEKDAEVALAMDSEKPVITLVSEDKIVVTQGEKWDQTLYPNYRVTDDRDSNLSNRVYVPEGKGYLNTNVAGEYPITLQVEDNWGNVGELVFTIYVEAPATGCNKDVSASTFIGLSLLGLAVFFVRRRRFV
ncbi:MAG: pullulanase-associated domain-containing protein [Bacilli bacterium]|nr:pullulanase-associated domain-containing protein [Bacilli bacterium]